MAANFSLRVGWIAISFLFAALASAAEPEPETILKWTDGVATDFLVAASQGDIAQAEALVGPTLRQAYDYDKAPHVLREWINNSITVRRLSRPTIETHMLSPSGNEVVVRGSFTNDGKITPFTLRLAKSNDAWLVSFFRADSATVAAPAKPEVAKPAVAKPDPMAKVDLDVKKAPVRPIPARPRQRSQAQLLLGDVPDRFSAYVLACQQGNSQELDVYLEDETVPVRQNEVVVNKPDEDVVLVLSSYESTIWRVGSTKGTRIVGVLLTGYQRQVVCGIDASVPVAISTVEKRGPFAPFHTSDLVRDSEMLDRAVATALGRAPSGFVHDRGAGVFYVGAKPKSDKEVIYAGKTPAEVSKPLKVARGDKGLAQLVADKKIRPAKQSDIDAWAAKAAEKNPKLVGPNLQVAHYMRLERTYVVLKETTLPAGLSGAGSAAFIVPEGVPTPTGPREHSSIYFMDGTKIP
jgi:hypothetical protein